MLKQTNLISAETRPVHRKASEKGVETFVYNRGGTNATLGWNPNSSILFSIHSYFKIRNIENLNSSLTHTHKHCTMIDWSVA